MDQFHARNRVVSRFLGPHLFKIFELLTAGAQTEQKLISRLEGCMHTDQVRKALKSLEDRGIVNSDRTGNENIWFINKPLCKQLAFFIADYFNEIPSNVTYKYIDDEDFVNVLRTPKMFYSSERIAILALICHSEKSVTEITVALSSSARRQRVVCALNNFERAGIATSQVKKINPDINIPILCFSATPLGQKLLTVLEKRQKKFGS